MHNYLLADRAGWTWPGKRTRNFQFLDVLGKRGQEINMCQEFLRVRTKLCNEPSKEASVGSCPTNHKITAGKVDALSSLQSFLTCCQLPISLSFPTRRAVEPLQLLHCLKITILVLITCSSFQNEHTQAGNVVTTRSKRARASEQKNSKQPNSTLGR
jgi:hypothetical protein